MVDTTPPDLQYVRCVDPSNSMDEPSNYQGTNSSMGAYWECSEDVGDIVEYVIQIGTQPGMQLIRWLIYLALWVIWWMSYKKQELFFLHDDLGWFRFIGGVHVALLLGILCCVCFTFFFVLGLVCLMLPVLFILFF